MAKKKELKKEIKATKAKISKQEGKLKKLKKKLKKAKCSRHVFGIQLSSAAGNGIVLNKASPHFLTQSPLLSFFGRR